jgi:phage nucleotide-binding protein
MKETNTNQLQGAKIKALLYGKSGTGKTSTALTLKPETTLILSAESGLLPLAGKPFTVWEMETFSDLGASYKRLLTPKVQKQFKVVFIDSLTEINELAKEKIVKVDRPKLGKDLGKVYDDLMTMQDYQLLQTRMTRMIRAYRDLPFHVIITCLEDNIKDERTGAISVVPSINGKLATNVAAYFDEVFRMVTKDSKDQVDYFFITAKMENAIAKDRSGALKPFEEASWKTVFQKIFKKFKVKEEK